jgi:hypothetical protein
MNNQERRENLLREKENLDNLYWDAQARLGMIALARAQVMDLIQECDNE